MDHATGTIFLYNMGTLYNMKSVLCDMRTELCDKRTELCDKRTEYVILEVGCVKCLSYVWVCYVIWVFMLLFT